jgi:hypothetical protein
LPNDWDVVFLRLFVLYQHIARVFSLAVGQHFLVSDGIGVCPDCGSTDFLSKGQFDRSLFIVYGLVGYFWASVGSA